MDSRFWAYKPQHICGYFGDAKTFQVRVQIGSVVMPNFVWPAPPFRTHAESVRFDKIEAAIKTTGRAYGEFIQKGFSPACYVEAMDRAGFDYMALYPTVGLFATAIPGMPPDAAAAIRRAYNNWLYDFIGEANAGSRLIGAGSLDLRDVDAAILEARRCVKELGFRALHIMHEPPYDGVPLHAAFYDPLWAEIAALGVPLACHAAPGSVLGQAGARNFGQDYCGRVQCAFGMETMITCLSLLGGGVTDRHPELKIFFQETGCGWVPYWLSRMYQDDSLFLQGDPVEHFKRQAFVTPDFREIRQGDAIRHLVDTQGDDSIVLGGEFSHPEGDGCWGIVEELVAQPRLSEKTKRKILWDNAARLYNLDPLKDIESPEVAAGRAGHP